MSRDAAPDAALDADEALWAAFATPQSAAEFYTSWLAILCAEVGQVNAALLLLREEAGSAFTPIAL